MRRFAFFLVAVATAGIAALVGPAPGHADGQAAPYVTEIPDGYRDWQWISSAHEAGSLNSLGLSWPMMWRSRPSAQARFRSRMARSLPLCITVTSRRRKTIKFLVRLNLSSPEPRRTFNLW